MFRKLITNCWFGCGDDDGDGDRRPRQSAVKWLLGGHDEKVVVMTTTVIATPSSSAPAPAPSPVQEETSPSPPPPPPPVPAVLLLDEIDLSSADIAHVDVSAVPPPPEDENEEYVVVPDVASS